MLFALNSELFQQVGDTNVYTAKNIEEIKPIIQKHFGLKTYVLDETKDYSISLTVSLGRISNIQLKYAYIMGSTSRDNTSEYVLSDFGTTEFTVPDEILAKRTPATTSADVIAEDKKCIA